MTMQLVLTLPFERWKMQNFHNNFKIKMNRYLHYKLHVTDIQLDGWCQN